MIIELLVVLLALYVGSRYGSLALGAISGIGLALLVFGFGMKPGSLRLLNECCVSTLIALHSSPPLLHSS